jgi:hypothetical protein
MAMMRRWRVFIGRVTLQADAVARSVELRTMRIVAVAAGDPGREHLLCLNEP